MALFKPFRGTRVTLPQELHDGYAYFCTDDGSFHIDFTDADGNLQRKQINAKDAETLTGMTLEEIKAYVTIQPDWNQTDETKADYIKNKPSIPTVNNGTLTIKQNGSAAKTFTANSASNVEVNIVTPKKLSDLSEDDNHRTVTLEEKTKLESAVTTTEFNQALSKANAGLKKRPIAYSSYKGEYTWEFSGNISDYESTVLGSPDGTDTNTMIAVKILDVAPSAEERELISYIMHTEMFPGGTPSVNQTSGQWSAFNGDERAYAVFLNDGSLPVIAAVYSTISEGEISITPGLWVMQMLINGENMLGVQTLNAPEVTIPGVKMNPDLIDMDWYAGKTEPITTNDLTIEWDGVVGDKYTISIQDPELGSSYTYVKVSDAVPTAEELATCEMYAKLGSDEEPQTGYTIVDGESLGEPCILIGNEDSLPQIIIVKKPYTSEFLGNLQQSGVYFGSVAENLYTSKLYLPSYTQYIRATLPEKYLPKINPDLIDAEWMAKKCSLEVEVNSENISNYLTDEISDLGAMFGFDVTLKLSDYFVSQDEFINGKCITEFGEVAGTEIPLIMGPGTADMGYTVTIENLWAYQLSDYVLLIADEGASVYVQDMNATFSVPKGIYLGADSEEELLALGTLKFYCPEVADVIVPLPEKFLSDMVVQAGTKTGYFPLDIEWDGEIGDRETASSSGEIGAFVKVSDLCDFTKEQLLTSTITVMFGICSDLIVEEKAYGYALCVPGQVEGNATSVTFVHVVHTPNDEFKSAGIYFVKTDLLNIGYVSNLHIQSYYQTITKKIDPELVDMDWYAGKRSGELDLIAPLKVDITDQETVLAPETDLLGNPVTTTYVKVSELTPTIEELRQGFFISDKKYSINELITSDTTGAIYLRSMTIGDAEAIVFALLWPAVLVLPEDATLDDKWDGSFHTKGTYLRTGSDSSVHIYLPYVEDAAELVKLPEKYLPDTINVPDMSQYATKEYVDEMVSAKADWSQNDANALDYVKNRTHWAEYGKVLVLAETTEKSFSEDYEWVWGEEPPVTSLPYIIPAKNYVVTLNNISYPVTGWSYTNDIGETSNWLGDSRKLQEVWGEDPLAIAIKDINPVEVPFLIYQEEYVVYEAEFPGDASQYRNNFQIYTNNNADLVKIERLTEELEYHTLDEKYLPDTVFRKSDIIVSQEDLVAGETPLETGRLYFVYE